MPKHMSVKYLLRQVPGKHVPVKHILGPVPEHVLTHVLGTVPKHMPQSRLLEPHWWHSALTK